MGDFSLYQPPKKASRRRCVLCGAIPAGRAHIKVSWFRGDDVVVAACRPCTRGEGAADALLKASQRPAKGER